MLYEVITDLLRIAFFAQPVPVFPDHLFVGQLVEHPLGNVDLQPGRVEEGFFRLQGRFRITSYNVCYTKLLRSGV